MSSKKTCTKCRLPKHATKDFYLEGRSGRRKTQCKDCIRELVQARQRGQAETSVAVPAPKKWVNLEAFDRECGAEPARVTSAEVTPVEEHRLKRKLAEQSSQIKGLLQDLSDAQAMGDIFAEAREIGRDVEPIKPRERLGTLREATAVALASDWHIEEEVRPEAVSGRNRYNLAISERRMTRFFEGVRWAINFNRQAFTIRDLLLWLGGDFITNYLHPDNIETNLLSPPEAIAYALASISAGIRFLLEDPELDRIVIPCNDGNHGRMTEKMRAAARVENSIETLMYTMLAREFRDEPRVKFIIAQGSQLYYEVYGRTIRFTHGDLARYGGGLGGVTIPLYKAISRWDTVRSASLTCVGHFHQLTSMRDLVINGSLIGYSAYALSIGARHEPPAQAFFMLDPIRFRSIDIPLWVGDAGDDSDDLNG